MKLYCALMGKFYFHRSCHIIVLSVDNDSQLTGMEYSSAKGKSVPSVSDGRKLQEKNLWELSNWAFIVN